MDKLTIVMSNYIDVECDANTTPRQAYERGFRRAAEKCETVMRSRKAKNDALESENDKLRELVRDMMEFFEDGDWCVKCERALDCQEQEQYEDECLMRFVFRDRMRELGIEVTGK